MKNIKTFFLEFIKIIVIIDNTLFYFLKFLSYIIHQRNFLTLNLKNNLLFFLTLIKTNIKTSTFKIPEPFRFLKKQNNFSSWIKKFDTLDDKELALLVKKIKYLKHNPKISILMPTFNSNVQFLTDAIQSVISQKYENWELCIVDDASTNKNLKKTLEHFKNIDSRIKVFFSKKNCGISNATNVALKNASGEWVGFLDHDDMLRPHTLFYFVEEINRHSNVKFLYSDEDKITEKNIRFDPFFKPDWNYDLFLSQNYICHFVLLKRSTVLKIGGLRKSFDGSQDYDLLLRYIEAINFKNIIHIPKILYHWRSHKNSTAYSIHTKSHALNSGQRALNEFLKRRKIEGYASIERDINHYRIHYRLPKTHPLVSIIIPTRNQYEILKRCVDSVIKKTKYKHYEICIVDNGSDDITTLNYLKKLKSEYKNIKIFKDPRPFNYSQLNNTVANKAKGRYLCLLNNDTEVISANWLSELLSIAIQPGVGAVGAKLYYSNNTIQHAGVILGIGGVAGTSHKYFSRADKGYFSRLKLIGGYSAVTAACLLLKKRIYFQVGGFNEKNLKIAFNDVDFCLKILRRGLRIIYTPYAELYHHESLSRGYEDTPEKVKRFQSEVMYMKKKWANILFADPAYNPNLTLVHEDFSLR